MVTKLRRSKPAKVVDRVERAPEVAANPKRFVEPLSGRVKKGPEAAAGAGNKKEKLLRALRKLHPMD